MAFVMMMRAEPGLVAPAGSTRHDPISCGRDHAMTAVYPNVPGVTFKDVSGFPGYCVGDDGSIWSCLQRPRHRNVPGSVAFLSDTWHRIKATPAKSGYHQVKFRRDNKQFTDAVHRVVLRAFVGPRPFGQEGCHFPDRDPANNRLENLRWDTPTANGADAIIHGTTTVGTKNARSKLDDEAIREIRRLASEGMSHSRIAPQFGVTRSTVSYVIRGDTWRHLKD
jgi:hypothetical protein